MTDVTFFRSGWAPLVRIVLVGVPMYVALIVVLRLSGSRTLASMNAFDFIVTVAIGSVFGRALTAKDVALAEAVVALALLVSLQYAVGSLQVQWPLFKWAITNPPTLLYFRGEFLREVMRDQRVTEAELHAAVRKKGFGSTEEVAAIVLESDGEFSIVETISDGSALGETLREQTPNPPDGED